MMSVNWGELCIVMIFVDPISGRLMIQSTQQQAKKTRLIFTWVDDRENTQKKGVREFKDWTFGR